MPRFEITSPDGQKFEINAPEGATEQHALAYAQSQFSRRPAAAPKPLTNDNPNPIDNFLIDKLSKAPGIGTVRDIQSSVPGRVIQGMADLPVGAMQLGANLVGLGDPVNKRLQEMNQRYEALRGPDAGFDAARLVGSVASPVAMAALAKVPLAATRIGKIGQGVAIGGAMGAASPVTDGGDNFAAEKAAQIASGAAIGGAIPAVAPLVTVPAKAAYHGLVEPWLKPAAIKGRAFLEAAGDKADDIIKYLRENKQLVSGSAPTAGEAAVPAGSAEFSALQRSASNIKPSEYVARTDAQNSARLGALRTVGQDDKALTAAIANRSANSAENYGAVAADKINPASDVAIMEVAIAGREAAKGEALRDWGRFATTEAQSNLKNVSGKPGWLSHGERASEASSAASDASGVAAYRQRQADYLKNALESLQATVGMDNRALSMFSNRPSMKAAVQDALLSAQETGAYFPAAKGEQFSVANLQRIKESLDAGISAAKKATDAGRRPELSPAELEGTRREFISWLSNKSPGWRDARLQHAQDSAPINQMKVGQYLEGKLIPALSEDAKQKAATYAGALADAPGTIKRATGTPRYDELTKILNPDQMNVVNSIRDDLARGARFESLAQKGAKASPDITGAVGDHRLTGMFSRAVTVANAVISRLEGKVNKRLAAEIAVEMLNPPKVADTLAQAQARAASNKLLARHIERSVQGTTALGIGAGERK